MGSGHRRPEGEGQGAGKEWRVEEDKGRNEEERRKQELEEPVGPRVRRSFRLNCIFIINTLLRHSPDCPTPGPQSAQPTAGVASTFGAT